MRVGSVVKTDNLFSALICMAFGKDESGMRLGGSILDASGMEFQVCDGVDGSKQQTHQDQSSCCIRSIDSRHELCIYSLTVYSLAVS